MDFVRQGFFVHKIPRTPRTQNRLRSEKESQNTIEEYERLLQIGKELLVESDVERMVRGAMDHLIKITGAEQGMVILFNKNGDFIFETARDSNKQDLEHPELQVNRTVIDQVKVKKTAVYINNASEVRVSGKNNYTRPSKIFSVICVPLDYDGEIFGVIYLDNRTIQDVFNRRRCTFVRMFADFISLAAHDVLERKSSYDRVYALEAELRKKYCFDSIIGHHPKMVEVLDLVVRVADTDATVLIQGECGTGKEIVARAIHENSSRRNKPFLAINCGALPDALLESELFGHEKGAYTGAIQKTIGKFEAADKGTIFLDEVDAMSSAVQVKLLRVLQSGEYSPLGSSNTKYCDVRIVAAAHQNLKTRVAQGKFREDLFYRLNIVPIFLPLLRDKKDDIPHLVSHFIRKFADTENTPQISNEAKVILQNYDYPGNVRELESAIRRAVIMSKSKSIDVEHLPEEMVGTTDSARVGNLSFHQAKARVVEAFEKEYLANALAKHQGNIGEAAKEAGLNRKNFREKMNKLAIDRKDFRK